MSRNLMLSATLLLTANAVITSYSTDHKEKANYVPFNWFTSLASQRRREKVRTSREIRCNQTSQNKDKAPTV
ncbi:hypothetical protein M747DRAFT_58595 [Aspergillus niger ATCC 13496]|uniref:Secreted protein n=1 Tax=Aspergillus niger ATCC 13496 TaxID=1353008 RepID=A0A370CGF5_ASPNG|nr:hypothetical protein M747DRAFT_58595 [Aspergillus niger ATCC 13496]